MKKTTLFNEEYDIHDPSLRALNRLVWKILFKSKLYQIRQEEKKLKQDAESYRFFQKAYNIAYLLCILNQQKLKNCRHTNLSNRYLPNSKEDLYLFYKSYLGRDKARDYLRYLNKWIPVYSKS